jgi:hypothetical protein
VNGKLLPGNIAMQNQVVQRGACAVALRDGPSPPKKHDVVLVVDPDEIPSTDQLHAIRSCASANADIWHLDMYMFNFDLACYKYIWPVAKGVSWAYALAAMGRPNDPRSKLGADYPGAWMFDVRMKNFLRNATFSTNGMLGSHMSYFNDVAGISTKIKNNAAQKYNAPFFNDYSNLEKIVAYGCDPHLRTTHGQCEDKRPVLSDEFVRLVAYYMPHQKDRYAERLAGRNEIQTVPPNATWQNASTSWRRRALYECTQLEKLWRNLHEVSLHAPKRSTHHQPRRQPMPPPHPPRHPAPVTVTTIATVTTLTTAAIWLFLHALRNLPPCTTC